MNVEEILEKLKFVPYEELERVDFSKQPLSQQLRAFAEGSEHIKVLAHEAINPILSGALVTGSTDREKAIVGCYYRAYAWMETLAFLKEPIHFQAVASGARSIFEFYVDLKLILKDGTGRSVERFHAFTTVERFRAAKKIVEFADANPTFKVPCVHQRNLVQTPGKGKEIDALVIKLWGLNGKRKPNFPKYHWTGLDLASRIIGLDREVERIYNEEYPRLSWYIHSGSVGYAGLDKEALQACFCMSHIIAQRLFLKIAEIIAEEMKIIKAVGQLKEAFGEARLVPGLFLLRGQFGINASSPPN